MSELQGATVADDADDAEGVVEPQAPPAPADEQPGNHMDQLRESLTTLSRAMAPLSPSPSAAMPAWVAPPSMPSLSPRPPLSSPPWSSTPPEPLAATLASMEASVEAGMEALRRGATELMHEDYVVGITNVSAKKKSTLNYYA